MKNFYLVTLVFVILLTAGCTNTVEEKKNDSKTTTTIANQAECVKEGGPTGGAPPAPGVKPKVCCSGLTQIPAIEVGSNGKCTEGVSEIFTCTKCGDGVCGAGENVCNCPVDCVSGNQTVGPKPIGGDKDEHGCLIAAGYTWCSNLNKCIRPWEENCSNKSVIGMANPASKFCVAQGGESKIITAADGSQSGTCILPGGVECNEWAYFRGECPAKHTCTAEEKAAEACTLEYAPVCGDDGVTYGNKCSACGSKKINEYTPGECLDKTYISRNLEDCKRIKYFCIEGKEPFTDEYGCGCKTIKPSTGKLKSNDCTEPRTSACTKEYMPVCGWFNLSIQCIKYPCANTYSNKCTACADATVAYWTDGKCPETSDGSEGSGNNDTSPGSAGMANPASTYCIKQGGKSEIKTAGDGSQYGICRWIDDRECDEWIYFRSNGAECKPVTEYTIAEKLNITCTRDEECSTPAKYLMLSHCPYTSICVDSACTVVCPKPFTIPGKQAPFCGGSTNATCTKDSDCIKGGCSSQLCMGKNENKVTTCEYTDCYNAAAYNLSCGCNSGKCSWT